MPPPHPSPARRSPRPQRLVAYVLRLAEEVKAAKETGLEICLVIGGGNIFRGVAVAAKGGNRVTGDHMGMLATVMNGIAFRDALERAGIKNNLGWNYALQALEMGSLMKALK